MSSITRPEANDRRRLETIIEASIRHHLEAARALREIRDRRLYRDDYDTFENYCAGRWGFSAEQGRRLCSWAEVSKNLEAEIPPIGGILILRESHSRALAKLTPQQQVIAFRRLPTGKKISAKHIEAVCSEVSRTSTNGKASAIPRLPSPTRTLTSPIASYGSKTSLAARIIEMIPSDHQCFAEVFCGSAAITLRKHPSNVEILNDRHDGIINVFRVLRDAKQAKELQRVLRLTPHARNEPKNCIEHPESNDSVERARRFVVRTRQSYGGRLDDSWSGGPVRNAALQFANAVDCLDAVAIRLRRVQVENKCFRELLPSLDKEKVVSFCDPPFMASTRSRGSANVYTHEMSEGDHEDLLKIVTRFRRGHVILCGHRSKLYETYLKKWRRYEVPVSCVAAGAGKREKRVEVIWCR